MLEIRNVTSGYEFIEVLHSVSLRVGEGEFVALLGPNGAGKSTLLRTVAGLVRAREGEITFRGTSIGTWLPHLVTRSGIGLVSEGLNLFTGMTVHENLVLGAHGKRNGAARREALESVLDLFPQLEARSSSLAGTLSGGERKMLALGRALMGDPALLLVDEPSLGLAPNVMASVMATLDELRKRGRTILLVEQNVEAALALADRAYVLEQGVIALEGTAEDLVEDPRVRVVYLGVE